MDLFFTNLVKLVGDGEANVEDSAGVVDVSVVAVWAALTGKALHHLARDVLIAGAEDVGHPGGDHAGEADEGDGQQGGVHGDGEEEMPAEESIAKTIP